MKTNRKVGQAPDTIVERSPRRRWPVVAGLSALLLTGLFATSAEAQQQRGMRYNCQNGAQMTVIFQRANNGTISLRYVYDGPESAMRTMQIVGHPDNGNFVDGQNRITILNQNPGTISYVEGNDLRDRCTVFQQF